MDEAQSLAVNLLPESTFFYDALYASFHRTLPQELCNLCQYWCNWTGKVAKNKQTKPKQNTKGREGYIWSFIKWEKGDFERRSISLKEHLCNLAIWKFMPKPPSRLPEDSVPRGSQAGAPSWRPPLPQLALLRPARWHPWSAGLASPMTRGPNWVKIGLCECIPCLCLFHKTTILESKILWILSVHLKCLYLSWIDQALW